MLALAPNTFGTLLWPLPDAAPPPPPSVPAPPSFLRSVTPALDRAFGLPDPWDLPDDLAALTTRLRAGPLGTRPDSPPAAEPDRPAATP
ncbi:hypothetical protein [Methylobacterium sp. J-068]|uniref:hypothetical protein n=1 Tax=Methylobacterium sp. J-068 TaxID=2836649 RepID=UPI001FB8E82A|nr:hypothetical protein [Methylobacterium sp. J-068]MCJ2033404.1 hypothetical protein [Methylobacterium sp. J-068]